MIWFGKRWQGMFILISIAASSGPALAEKPLSQLSTEKLCNAFGNPEDQRFMRPDVGDEIVRRGASYCMDREYMALKREAQERKRARDQERGDELIRMGSSLQKCGRVSC